MPTKTLQKKIAELAPPRDIRNNTKARRAWLAAKVDEVNAEPGRSAKIVGVGSYQVVSVWAAIEREGRIQLRGTCQGCGRQQAVDPTLAKHGYTVKYRGQGGFFAGTCHGSDRLPAEQDVSYTRELIGICLFTAAQHEAAIPDAQVAADAAVKPPFPEPSRVWRDNRLVAPDTEPGRAWKAYRATREHPLWLATEAKHLRLHADELTRNVLPRFGQPLVETIIT